MIRHHSLPSSMREGERGNEDVICMKSIVEGSFVDEPFFLRIIILLLLTERQR